MSEGNPQNYEKEIMDLGNGKWNDARAFFRKMSSLNVKILLLNKNKSFGSVKEIVHIRFINMIELELWQNALDSVEGLENICMPHLQQLRIRNNNIRTIKVLRKTNWPELTFFNIWNNYALDMKSLTECYFPKLERLWAHFTYRNDKNKFVDLGFPAKIQTKSLTRLTNQTTKFEAERAIRISLSKKWKNPSLQ